MNQLRRKQTAVSPLTTLLLATLLPVLLLATVTSLLAQSSQPEAAFILAREDVDEPEATTYQIHLQGLVETNGTIHDITELEVRPLNQADQIFVANGENGRIPVNSLENERFDLMLLLDSSGSMSGNLSQAKDLITTLVNREIRSKPNACISLVGFNGDIKSEWFFPTACNQPDELLAHLHKIETDNGETCLFDTLFTAVDSMRQRPSNHRRAIIVFTDGVDEVKQFQNQSCSTHDFSAVEKIANDNKLPIHIMQFPYSPAGSQTVIKSLKSSSSLSTGLSITKATEMSTALARIIHSFAKQWEATIAIHTPAGTNTLEVIPFSNGRQVDDGKVAYTAQYGHYPPTTADMVEIQRLHWVQNPAGAGLALEAQFTLCDTVQPYCNPANLDTIAVTVEDRFTNQSFACEAKASEELFGETSSSCLGKTTLLFQPAIGLQNITIPLTLPVTAQVGHSYLVRLTAVSDITDQNRHPNATFAIPYTPTLTIKPQATNPQLTGLHLQPTMTLQIEPIYTITNVTLDVTPTLIVSGYLRYADQNKTGVYLLPHKTVPSGAPTTLTYTVPGGWDDYHLVLDVTHPTDGSYDRLEQPTEIPAYHLIGRTLRLLRHILDRPLYAVLAIAIFLLLLLLVALAAQLIRRWWPAAPTGKAHEESHAAKNPVPKIVVKATPNSKLRYREYPITTTPFRIGSGSECHITIDDDKRVAQRHAEIKQEGNIYTITNLNDNYSTYLKVALDANGNGDDSSFADRKEIISDAPIPLSPDTEIHLGAGHRLTFTHGNGAQKI